MHLILVIYNERRCGYHLTITNSWIFGWKNRFTNQGVEADRIDTIASKGNAIDFGKLIMVDNGKGCFKW